MLILYRRLKATPGVSHNHPKAKELATVSDLIEREALFKNFVGQEYERGKAINVASKLEIDAVIDPAETRAWLSKSFTSACVKP